MKYSRQLSILFFAVLLITAVACGKKNGEENTPPPTTSSLDDKGVGPVKSLTLVALDPSLASKGQQLFQSRCSVCHKIEEKFVGPALKAVTQRRSPEWILNMILNPQEMTQKDPVAHELLAIHYVQMTFQNVTQEDARSILEFFRQNDSQLPK
ncbi:MAG: cytochrome c [Deltaproteobacteria bacterium]|nr:cytochrome c [Deltaproteobacteria bacterium]